MALLSLRKFQGFRSSGPGPRGRDQRTYFSVISCSRREARVPSYCLPCTRAPHLGSEGSLPRALGWLLLLSAAPCGLTWSPPHHHHHLSAEDSHPESKQESPERSQTSQLLLQASLRNPAGGTAQPGLPGVCLPDERGRQGEHRFEAPSALFPTSFVSPEPRACGVGLVVGLGLALNHVLPTLHRQALKALCPLSPLRWLPQLLAHAGSVVHAPCSLLRPWVVGSLSHGLGGAPVPSPALATP